MELFSFVKIHKNIVYQIDLGGSGYLYKSHLTQFLFPYHIKDT